MNDHPRKTAWIDLLLERLRLSRISPWLIYPAILIILTLADRAIFIYGPDQGWIDSLSGPFAFAWALAINDALHRLAANTFDQFSPSLDLPANQININRQRFRFAPPWISWVSLILGINTFFTFWAAGVQEGLLVTVRSPVLAFVYGLIIFGGNSSFVMYFVINSIRRLRLITQFHELVEDVDLNDLAPLRAFSRFSSSTAVVMLLIIAVTSRYSDGLDDFAFTIVLAVLAIVVFLVPLMGLRNRIKAKKESEIQSVNSDLALVALKTQEALRNDKLEKLSMLKDGQDNLLIQREELTRIRTWPWQPATVRGFSSAFLLPILIWLITRMLERFI